MASRWPSLWIHVHCTVFHTIIVIIKAWKKMQKEFIFFLQNMCYKLCFLSCVYAFFVKAEAGQQIKTTSVANQWQLYSCNTVHIHFHQFHNMKIFAPINFMAWKFSLPSIFMAQFDFPPWKSKFTGSDHEINFTIRAKSISPL